MDFEGLQMKKFIMELLVLATIIWGPSLYVENKATRLADQRFGENNYCWFGPKPDSDRRGGCRKL
jgi:hypothetical protein